MPASAQVVSELLEKAGFPRSTVRSIALRGISNRTRGFYATTPRIRPYDVIIREHILDVIIWEHVFNGIVPSMDRDTAVAMLRKYAEVLERAGYKVELVDDDHAPELHVSKD